MRALLVLALMFMLVPVNAVNVLADGSDPMPLCRPSAGHPCPKFPLQEVR